MIAQILCSHLHILKNFKYREYFQCFNHKKPNRVYDYFISHLSGKFPNMLNGWNCFLVVGESDWQIISLSPVIFSISSFSGSQTIWKRKIPEVSSPSTFLFSVSVWCVSIWSPQRDQMHTGILPTTSLRKVNPWHLKFQTDFFFSSVLTL